MKFSKITNPQWVNAEKTMIDCMVTFDHISEPVPFTASQKDIAEHGRLIFEMCKAGECGEVAAYVPPPEPVATTVKTTS